MFNRVIALSCVLLLTSANSLAEESVHDLIDASAEELEDKKLAAEQKKTALRSLVTGGSLKVVAPQSTKAESASKDRSLTASVAQQPREYEPSESKVPSALDPGVGEHSFDSLRKKLSEAPYSGAALQRLADYVARYSNHREARLLLGRGQILNGKAELALRTLEPLLIAPEPDWQASFWVGSSYLALGQMDLANLYLGVALDKHGDSSDLWVQAAVLEQEQGRHAGAIQFLDVAAQLAPNHAEIHLNKGYSLEHLGEYEKALSSYRRFLVSQKNEHTLSLRSEIMSRIAIISTCLSSLSSARTGGDSEECAG